MFDGCNQDLVYAIMSLLIDSGIEQVDPQVIIFLHEFISDLVIEWFQPLVESVRLTNFPRSRMESKMQPDSEFLHQFLQYHLINSNVGITDILTYKNTNRITFEPSPYINTIVLDSCTIDPSITNVNGLKNPQLYSVAAVSNSGTSSWHVNLTQDVDADDKEANNLFQTNQKTADNNISDCLFRTKFGETIHDNAVPESLNVAHWPKIPTKTYLADADLKTHPTFITRNIFRQKRDFANHAAHVAIAKLDRFVDSEYVISTVPYTKPSLSLKNETFELKEDSYPLNPVDDHNLNLSSRLYQYAPAPFSLIQNKEKEKNKRGDHYVDIPLAFNVATRDE
eukprot:TRINITY_DN287_c0_g1_i1.p1 TRINITY_DN287_c0_g1~~TRINITY_DN287_c0_g1_i1.p1  ORF type:complete len:338 (+),score=67.35 TRINITY_DN287_c0_g1_i1:46-1059(+)